MLTDAKDTPLTLQTRLEALLDYLHSDFDVAKKPEQGVILQKALMQAGLDYSTESLERLYKLFRQIRQQKASTVASLLQKDSSENFLLLVSGYLGSFIAKQSQQKAPTSNPLQWLSYSEAKHKLPANVTIEAGNFSYILVVINNVLCFPLGVIEDVLENEKPKHTFVSYVAEMLEKISDVPTNKHDWSALYLNHYQQNKPIPGGLAFAKQLSQIKFDYSFSSVMAIDDLLSTIHKNEKLTVGDYGAFVNHAAKANFMLLLVFYLGKLVAKEAKSTLRWLSYDEFKANTQDETIKANFETSHICVVGQKAYFPLQVISETLFNPNVNANCLRFVCQAIQTSRASFEPIYFSAMNPQIRLWQHAMLQAGFLAAYAMYKLFTEAQFEPTLIVPDASTNSTNFIELTEETPQLTIEKGLARLAENPHQLNSQTFAFVNDVYLATGKQTAVELHIASYAEQPLRLQIWLPYRAKTGEQEFTILSPMMNVNLIHPNVRYALFTAFNDGLTQFTAPDMQANFWLTYLKEN